MTDEEWNAGKLPEGARVEFVGHTTVRLHYTIPPGNYGAGACEAVVHSRPKEGEAVTEEVKLPANQGCK